MVEFFSSFAKMLVSRVNAGQKAQKWSSLIQSMEDSVLTPPMKFGAIPMSFGQVRGPWSCTDTYTRERDLKESKSTKS